VNDSEDPRAEERVGSVLDEKWTLERILGSGGMGAVYAARHRNGAKGAVKILHPELARRADVRERFLREGYAANRVEHRGAVQVLDDDVVKEGPDEGTAYLVMEMLEGESLEQRLDRGPPLTELELLPILDDVLAVLEAAHEHGVVHRDLKPANLFLNKDPSGPGVKVLDFGLARLEELRSVTGVGLALGTPSFMAPEQANGRSSEIDARTDLFAIGATAFNVLAGRGVHEADGVLELVARMGTLPAPKLREIAPQVSEEVARVVDRALEFKREDRYPSAAAMRADVQSARSVLSPPVLPAAEDVKAAELTPSSRDRGEESVERPRRGRALAPMILGAVVAGGLLLAFVPPLRERAGAVAMNELFTAPLASGSASALLASEPSAPTSSLSPPASALSPPDDLASAVAAASASAGPPIDLDADADADDVSSVSALDASADASDDASDDDDDDDDPDAAVAAPVIASHPAGGGAVAVHPPAIVKHPPRVRPPSKHGHPPRKKRRPRR
jgi:serine/threonine-protein kinase